MFNSALAHVKARVAARQFQLFDLHVLQGMSVTETAQISGVRVASVYMAKYRVGRIVRREVERLKKSID